MKKQNGFAALEGVLILVIVAIIAGVGWYAYHTKKQTDKILNQADKNSQSIPVKQSSNLPQSSKLVFKEYGVQIQISSDLKGLNYTYSEGVASVYTPEISKIIASCNGETDNGHNAFAIISKSNGQYSDSGGPVTKLKQFSGFWIGGASAIQGITCSNSDDKQNLENLYSKTNLALQNAFLDATLTQ